jgi:hypothetical protein
MRYDQIRLRSAIDDLAVVGATTAKGHRLQDLTEWLLSALPGVVVSLRNTTDDARSEEKDLWIQHDPRVSGLPFSDMEVPIECKNKRRRASASDVRDFAAKIRNSGGFDGVLVTTSGLSGRAGEAGHQAITLELSQRTRITVVSVSDLEKLAAPENLRLLLVDRHAELRSLQTYRSI